MNVMEVKVRLSPKAVWRLEDEAESAGMNLSEYAGLLLQGAHVARGSHSTKVEAGAETRRRIAELHADGLTDAEIAAEVDRVQEHVARLRRGLGLKPNKRRDAA